MLLKSSWSDCSHYDCLVRLVSDGLCCIVERGLTMTVLIDSYLKLYGSLLAMWAVWYWTVKTMIEEMETLVCLEEQSGSVTIVMTTWV